MNMIKIRPFLVAKLALFAVAPLILLASCDFGISGNGHVTTENRPVADFTTVEAHGAFDIEWSTGGPALAITTDQNLLQYIESSVTGHKLVLRTRESLRPTHGNKVRITSSKLTSAGITGAVRLSANHLTGDNFFLDATGATRTTLEGSVTAFTASMSGASKLVADNLHTQTSEMSISGAGKADVDVHDKLSVTISGAGKVTYSGNPRAVEKRVSGAGSIRSRE
jgi:hypothetical protein